MIFSYCYTDGTVKLYGKQDRSLRAVPMPLRAAQALDELPARLDTRVLFPGKRGGYLNLHNWRAHEWTPAVRAAGVLLFELARFMGTSTEQIDKTYGHLLPDSLDRARTALDSFIADEADEAFGH
ncbi:MAG TPA: hypothetical protein VLB86_02370 [Gaiellaceae bacterium]|nr:hypothetical protein [Gaiellaceae bacterium]